MVSTCGESLPPPWLSSFQTVDPLAHLFATCLLPSPNPAVWCHPRPPLQPRPSPLAILTPATARVGAPWLLLRAETRIEGSARIGRLSYLHTRIHIYIHRFKCCPSGYRWSWLWKRPLRRWYRDREVGDPLMAGRERAQPDTYARPKSRTRTGTVDRSCALPTLGRLPASRGGWFLYDARPFLRRM